MEIALCWGWIDGQKKGLDDQHFLQRFTPRRARSVWSKVNVEKVAALIAAGRMQAPGLAQVEAAKADGRWARAYDGARTAVVPDDLQAALDAQPPAKAFFATLNAEQPLRGVVAHPDRREARDARPSHCAAGGHAGARGGDSHLQAQVQPARQGLMVAG